MKKLSIIILNYNTKKLTGDCVLSLSRNIKNLDYEVILVDNASADGSQECLSKLVERVKNVELILSKVNLGFSKGNNLGIKKSKGDYVLLLNSDTVVSKKSVSGIVDWMDANPEVGISSCGLKNKDGSIQATGGYFPTLLRVASWMTIEDLPFVKSLIKPFHPLQAKSPLKDDKFYSEYRELDWVTGAFFLIRRKVIEEIGVMDEDYFMYTEDTDYCFRAKKAGWKIAYVPDWSIVHLGGGSSKSEFSTLSEYRGIKLFFKKHYPSWQYPVLRVFLKIGSLWRAVVFGLIEGKEAARIYAKAFGEA